MSELTRPGAYCFSMPGEDGWRVILARRSEPQAELAASLEKTSHSLRWTRNEWNLVVLVAGEPRNGWECPFIHFVTQKQGIFRKKWPRNEPRGPSIHFVERK